MSCSDQNIDVVLELARHAETVGADYIVVHAPALHFHTEQDETLLRYYRHISEHVDIITSAAESHERPRPRLSYMTALVTNDDEFEATRRGLTFRLVDSPPEVRNRIGMTQDDADRLRTAISEGGLDAAAEYVRPDWVDKFAIVGSADECRAELADLMEKHGLDEFQGRLSQAI